MGVQGIPAVIVVDSSGEILTKDGRSEILNLGVQAFKVKKFEEAEFTTKKVQFWTKLNYVIAHLLLVEIKSFSQRCAWRRNESNNVNIQ